MTPQRCAGTRRDGRLCGRRLLDMDAEALRPGKRIAIKCHDCNHVTTFEGRGEGAGA